MSERIDRRRSIGGSDARIIMGDDEGQLIRLWREKRGDIEPEDLSHNLIVQLGTVTEDLNRRWYQFNTACVIKDVQKRIEHPVNKWMSATPAWLVDPTGTVVEAKFMCLGRSRRRRCGKTYPQLQHNMRSRTRGRQYSPSSPGGKWVEMSIHAHPLYQHLLITAERKFWRRADWRDPTAVRDRAAEASAASGGTNCRHERVEMLGEFSDLSQHATGIP